MARIKHRVKIFPQRLHCLSALHLLCTGRRGAVGEKTSTSNIYTYFESTWGGFRPFFARTNTFHPQDDVVWVVESSSQEGFTLCGHQTQANSSVSRQWTIVETRVEGTNLPLFVPAPREMRHRRTPAIYFCVVLIPSWRLFLPNPLTPTAYTWKWGRNLIPSLKNNIGQNPSTTHKHFLGVIFLFVWADCKAFLWQEASGLGFLCLLVQIPARVIEPLAKRKLWPIRPYSGSSHLLLQLSLLHLDWRKEKVLLSRCPLQDTQGWQKSWASVTLYLLKCHSIYCIYIVTQIGGELGWLYPVSSRLTSASPNSRSYPCFQAREIRRLESLKLIFYA